jgi:hypothetical protein
MAAAAQKDPQGQDPQDIPTTFPPGTLFVGVNDGIQQYAGEDGGPQQGGKGRWRTGEVGPWTSRRPVPLAHRDPDSGMIWKGWVEPVLRSHPNERGQLVCDESQQFFSQPIAVEQRAAAKAKQRGMMSPTAKRPTSKAARRARLGAPPMADALKPLGQQLNAAASAGIPLDDDRVPPGRASDRAVG